MNLSKRQVSILIFILCIYFCTKMLWDSLLFGIFEYISILLILFGGYYFFIKTKRRDFAIIILFAIYTTYIFLNGFMLTDTTHLMRGLYEYIFYAFIFFSSVGLLRKTNYDGVYKCIRVLCYLGVILSVLTFVEYLLGKSFISSNSTSAVKYGTIISGYGYVFRPKVFSRSYLSHGLIMGILSLCNLYMYKKEKRKLYVFWYILCVISILLTSSRGPLVATFVSSLIIYLEKFFSKKISKKILLRNAFIVVFFLLCFYIIFYTDIHFNNESVDYFLQRTRNIINWENDGGNVGRIKRWSTYIQYFISNNIFVGSGVSITGSSGLSTLGLGTTESGVIKRLVELGIIGIFIHYFMIILIIKQSAHKKKDGNSISRLAIAIVTCILIDDVTLQITEEIMISALFWFFLAVYYVNPMRNESESLCKRGSYGCVKDYI